MLDAQTPLHEVRRMQLAVGYGRDRDGRETIGCIGEWRRARELALRESRAEVLVGGDSRIHRAVRHAGCDRRAAHGTEQSALKRPDVRRIHADQIGDAARHDVAEYPKAAAEHCVRRELPGNGGPGLQDRQRRGGEQVPKAGLNDGVERLIDIVGDRIEGAGQASRSADADSRDSS